HMPATPDTAMASVPVDLAGKASAVNNAGRQLGGTLAIAILGSFAAAAYSSGVNSGLGPVGLPEQSVEILATGIGAAQQVLPTLDPSLLGQTQLVLRESFVDAISNTMRFGIIFALIAGIVGWILVPKRQRQEQMQWEDGKPVEQPVAAVAAPRNGASVNGTREITPKARSVALVRPQKSGIP
ncbi:MAG: hypothetical protein OXH38_00230, partial [Chloroflexi bacterium]|nr:hypothetical protein [Chloroflexota bacterium]